MNRIGAPRTTELVDSADFGECARSHQGEVAASSKWRPVARFFSQAPMEFYGVYTAREVSTASKLQGALAGASSEHQHDKYSLDLSRLANVRSIARTINKRVAEGSLPPIRALILNAGYQEYTEQYFSENGLDMSFQCNYLSHWLLTLMLLQSLDKAHGRIIVLGSSTHDPNHPANDSIGMFKDKEWKILFHDTHSLAKGTWSSAREYSSSKSGFRRYGAGKLCEIMMIYEFQRRLDRDPVLANISVLGIDPGGMPSGLTRRGSKGLVVAATVVLPVIAPLLQWRNPNGGVRTTSKSAGDVLRTCFDSKSLGETPKALYLNGTEVTQPSLEARDTAKQGMLWRDSITYANLQQGETLLRDWA
ncbi:hypothetical protein UA08_07053 [Talaromyces atroroseus]|uniref:Short-chain dehydrogenase TIC 32, chloroplastic n=1 Tax=Talaromyces atroroseus TaxID=1441469 RepID=A0A225AST8_TALAT|nr:hypothetical protein UA08_07053 [Talaromyces atroroseus]OKL57485.1 hypothetical protein UA08_07053 [Talaromyces atroroseus]